MWHETFKSKKFQNDDCNSEALYLNEKPTKIIVDNWVIVVSKKKNFGRYIYKKKKTKLKNYI